MIMTDHLGLEDVFGQLGNIVVKFLSNDFGSRFQVIQFVTQPSVHILLCLIS